MPFVHTNNPGSYSAMRKNFKYEWDIIFIETLRKIGTLFNEQVTVTKNMKSLLEIKR